MDTKYHQPSDIFEPLRELYSIKYANLNFDVIIASDNIDEVIALIRASSNADEARTNLMERFKLTEIQAKAIVAISTIAGRLRIQLVGRCNPRIARPDRSR